MKSIRVIIAGSREFTDYRYLENKLDETLYGFDYEDIEIVCGACKGIDLLADRYAVENNLPFTCFSSTSVRNGVGNISRIYQMVHYATHCIVFQVNNSKGSQHMINIATAKRLELIVFTPNENTLLVMSSEQGSNQSLNDTQKNN